MSLAAGTTFQGLKLLASCGGGAYGEVWYCEDLSGRRMAVKIVSKTRLGDAWKRELQGVVNYRRITENSPYLLRIFHVAEDGENFYYTMEAADSASGAEYVPDTLAHRLKSGALPPEQLFPVLAGVFNGLAAIHQAGFAHRDIKPDNILFVGGVPKLADIGLVSSLSNSLTRLAGTLDFLPPEERSGDTGSTDRASRQRNDLYAFGKVVYCAATGLEPGQYPSLPTDAKLSLELKLFLRLAFRLCARESHLRIGDLSGLYREMARIERQLESGETASDKVRYAWECLWRGLLAGVLWFYKTWWIFLLVCLIFGGVFYFLWREYRNVMLKIETTRMGPSRHTSPKAEPPPKKPTEPPPAPPPEPPAKDKIYAIAALGLEMRIPNHWQPMSESHIRAQVEEMTKELDESAKDEAAKKLLRHAIARAKTWKGLIRCDLYDVIEISRIEGSAAQLDNLWTLPEADLKRVLVAQYDALNTESAQVYGVGRMMLAGRRCIVFDFTPDRKNRLKKCMLTDDSGVTIIALTADAATFDRRVKEFDAALKTLKFAGPAPKYAPVKTVEPPKPKAKPAPEPPKPEVKPIAKTPEPAPAPPEDPNTRKYVNKKHGFTMRVPLHWEQMSRMYIEQLIRDRQTRSRRGGKTKDMENFDLDHLQNILRNGGTIFRCDFDAKHCDNVEIAPLDVDTKELWSFGDEDIRGMYQLEADKRSMPVAFYAVRRARIAGRNALIVESSNNVASIQSVSCMVIVSDSRILTFALSAKRANFAKRKKEFDAALKTLEFSAGTENVYDLSRKKVETLEIGGTRTSKYGHDDLLNAEVEIPATWFEPGGGFFRFGEKVLYDDFFPGVVAWEYTPTFSIENRYTERADSNIRVWNTCLVSTDLLRNGSAEQLKNAIGKDFYFEYALPSTKFWEKGFDVTKNLSIPEFLKFAQTVLPEGSIAVSEIKRFSVGGQPAVYAEIDSPSTHKHRKLVYCLVAPKGLKNCFVILLDADAKKEVLRKKQFFEFCRHFKIFTK